MYFAGILTKHTRSALNDITIDELREKIEALVKDKRIINSRKQPVYGKVAVFSLCHGRAVHAEVTDNSVIIQETFKL